ncbi:MAG: hypothetical protein JRJ43_02620 [Deltaproteobacteria bacterium]|nr:hypothetical protein [Deltaproteobacteria bacterium]MBW1718444.1 hypothetical protein [Deltaproteobacteria bacterium]MBW1931658.1 hypothetical protein [Deltaproteobacteria bacterium]MBW1939473.1 hypothetical protein [Deltaproteobacteria bacterium]MBW2080612.1 hypothetical protein [Deltaproteobacteria bacterium]
MQIRYFEPDHVKVLDEAISISEDVISNYFSISSDYWLRNPYEIRTLSEVSSWEYPGEAFAHLVRYGKKITQKQSGRDIRKFYRICLHDHNILDQTSCGKRERLFPFLIYVMTHEFVHIMRFSCFFCHPEIDDRNEEEQKVHLATKDILTPVGVRGMDAVLDRFFPHSQLNKN